MVLATKAPVAHQEVLSIRGLSVYYGAHRALRDITMSIAGGSVTAIIGPSGCGKSTLLRCINRMNDLVPNLRVEGSIYYRNVDLYHSSVDPVLVRRSIGIVFQKPNPYPTSIYDNIAWGLKVNGIRSGIDDAVEESLTQAALWDEVKDRLKKNAFNLSGGQQQRLCIARAIALKPEILLMDEPTSFLDPLAARQIEDLIEKLKALHTIIIVSHNLNLAARVSDYTAGLFMDEHKTGYIEEYQDSYTIFIKSNNPKLKKYILGAYPGWHDGAEGGGAE